MKCYSASIIICNNRIVNFIISKNNNSSVESIISSFYKRYYYYYYYSFTFPLSHYHHHNHHHHQRRTISGLSNDSLLLDPILYNSKKQQQRQQQQQQVGGGIVPFPFIYYNYNSNRAYRYCSYRSVFPIRISNSIVYHPVVFVHTIHKRMVQSVAIVDNCIININPATGEAISRIPCTTKDEINTMVDVASKVQKKVWRTTPVGERIRLLKEGLVELSKYSDKLTNLIVSEMGKPIREAEEEVVAATSKDEYFIILEESLQPKQHGSSVVVRHPIGVVTIISPWNFPADEILLLALPALASGNTVIVKPSEVVPETGAFVVNILASVLPTGVIQLAQGDGIVGSYLVSNDKVDMIAMTGSSATGQKILQSAVSRPKMKRYVLEMGGKDPMIVFDDADIDSAVVDAVKYSLANSGQVCCSIERIYIAQSIYSDFQQRIQLEATKYKVGNGIHYDVDVGPLVSIHQKNIVQEQVDDAIQKGAKLLYQSEIPVVPPAEQLTSTSSFYPVTVVADVQPNMKLYTDETFGPVVTLIPFDGTEESAIELANDTPYGLASSVYTKDYDRAKRVAESIDAGQVGINCYSIEHMNVACPWVGHKNSGFGYHSGQEGFHNFSIPKSLVYIDESDDEE